jgi:hypothetical protein
MAQTSIHFQAVKGGSEEHNRREKKLDYVHEDLTPNNEYWEIDTQENRLEFLKKNAKEKTGRKMQAKATPIREAVVVISELTTMDDLKNLSQKLQERFGIKIFQIAIHKDEGYIKGKDGKLNLHAHLVADWTDHETGKSLKLNRDDMSEMQTITAEVLGMERGVSSDKQHLSAIQYKAQAEQQRADKERKKAEENKKAAEKALLKLSNAQEETKAIYDNIEVEKAVRTQLNSEIEDLEKRLQMLKRNILRVQSAETLLQEYERKLQRKSAEIVQEYVNASYKKSLTQEEVFYINTALGIGKSEQERDAAARKIVQDAWQNDNGYWGRQELSAGRYGNVLKELQSIVRQEEREQGRGKGIKL